MHAFPILTILQSYRSPSDGFNPDEVEVVDHTEEADQDYTNAYTGYFEAGKLVRRFSKLMIRGQKRVRFQLPTRI